MNKLLIMAAVAIFVVACTKNAPIKNIDANTHQIKISSSIEGATKDVVVVDNILNDINFLRLDDKSDSKTSDFNFTGKVEIVGARATSGDITLNPTQLYQSDNQTSYFIGYHPIGTVTAKEKIVWTIDGATDILLTDVWNAGNITTPKTTGLVFRHQLARVEVICKADASMAINGLQSLWGNIEYIKFVNAKPEMTYTYSTNKILPTGTATDFTLLNGNGYETGAFIPVAIQSNATNVITASAMLPPIASTSISFKVKTVNKTERILPAIVLSGNLDRAKVHQVVLTFMANGNSIDIKTSTIEGWVQGANGSGNVTE